MSCSQSTYTVNREQEEYTHRRSVQNLQYNIMVIFESQQKFWLCDLLAREDGAEMDF